MTPIHYHREGQGWGTILCRPEDRHLELTRLKLDPQVTFPITQAIDNYRRAA